MQYQAYGDDFLSKKYIRLNDCLKENRWREADQETDKLISRVIGKEIENSVVEDFQDFPCNHLLTIDKLWVRYSNGHFGFSIQKEIYIDFGGRFQTYNGKLTSFMNNDDQDAWNKFIHKVGWIKQKPTEVIATEVIYDIHRAPKGHLPYWYNKARFAFFLGVFYRIDQCKNNISIS
ncbi:GUN4 domain-containing protein [Nostoc sp.]|uniref:GUN4 domain-containing protein n=1 Tax=Nostoc sp. TaxID=1180 RepID=UPI002FF69F6A